MSMTLCSHGRLATLQRLWNIRLLHYLSPLLTACRLAPTYVCEGPAAEAGFPIRVTATIRCYRHQ